MLTLSLLLNILVLIPICYLILTNNVRIVENFCANSTQQEEFF